MTVRAIARRAGAGLATLYRRWPTKEDLVIGTGPELRGRAGRADPDTDADPVDVLVELVGGLVNIAAGAAAGLYSLVGQLPANPAWPCGPAWCCRGWPR